MDLFVHSIFYLCLVAAGMIAYISKDKKYKWIALVLFIEFLLVSAYELFIFAPENNFVFENYRDLAPFYAYKMLMQSVFTIAYIHLQSKSLTILSVMIMSVLGLSTFLSLYNIDVIYYEQIMLALSISQLIAGFGGAIGGYCNMFNDIRSWFSNRRNYWIHK